MKFERIILLLMLVFFSVSEASQTAGKELPKTEGPWIVMAYYSNKSQVLAIRNELDVWKVDQKNQSVMMSVKDLVEYQQLLDIGFSVKINHSMMDEYANIPRNNWRSTDTIPGFACYRTVEETYAVMDSLVSNNPTLASIVDIGDSWDKVTPGGNPGYDLRVIKITNQNIVDPDKPILYAMGSIHSREYPPAELVTRFSEYLINNYNIDADATWLVDHHEIHLLLQGNPDGRKISEAEASPNQRKNRNANHCPEPNANFEQQGVDMNRNFPFKWNQGSGSSGNPCSQVYRGLSALSEPENFAIDTYIKTLFPDERPDDTTTAAPLNKPGVYLDIHNVANMILFPFGYDNNNPLSPNHDQLLTLGRRMGFYNNYSSGTAESLLGPADGASEDNAYGALGVAAYTFELGEIGFYSSCSSFENTIWPDNLPALIYAAKASRMPYVTPAGPDSINLTLDVQQILAGDIINISGTATDLKFNNNGTTGNEATQNISSVNVFLNLASWQVGASAIVATAGDGTFDSSSESFTAQIITEGLLVGNHMLFVESTDAEGVTGVPSAIFFEVLDPGNLGTLQGIVTD
ncbi:MAG: hypothetical protein L3J52_07080, partial [Proteobacteria bacterium]|nr:hypothetical protein [Pseudomonadota bacterium]